MELGNYLRVLIRYWWLIVALVIIVAFGSFILRPQPAPVFQASVRFTIGVNAPTYAQANGYDPILTSYQASEYIRDDFVEVVQSDLFADDVTAQLRIASVNDITVRKGAISAAIEKQRRLMSMTVTWNDADQATKIIQAAVKNLSENNPKYFAQLGSSPAMITIIDTPAVSRVGASLREQMDIPIRVALAFLAGIALAFILDYLDQSVRDARDVESLGIQVIGEIPKPKTR
jgi:succinoglycan biosynthesis transport protein ExoP